MTMPINKKSILTFYLFICLALTASGNGSDDIFKVSKATQPILIDGKLDEAWGRTEVGNLEHFRRDESPSDRQKSTVRMLWDEKNLYVFFECKDRFITARETKRDGQPYFDDCAEIFIIPANAQLDMHFGFELNLYKASNDFIFLNKIHEGKDAVLNSYNPDFEVEVSIDGTVNDNSDSDQGWSMELAIPLKLFIGMESLSPVASGNRWAFQAIRQDRNDPSGDRRAWATLFPVLPKNPSVHEPEDFGFLEFVE